MPHYKVGDFVPLHDEGEQVANARILRKFVGENGESMLDAQVIALSPDYQRLLEVGTKVTLPAGGLVYTFKDT